MKKPFTIFLLFAFFSAKANHFTFGTPGSSASLTSMSGINKGDTGYIAAGTYTFLQASGLDSIHILPLDPNNIPIFTQNSTIGTSNRYCEIAHFKFIYGGTGSTIAWTYAGGGHSYHNNYHDNYFYGWSSSVISAHNNILYTPGDTTTLISYEDIFHDIIVDSCGQFFQGSFGNISSNSWNPPDVFDSTTFYNIQDIGTSLCCGNGQGTGIRGIFFRLTVHDCYITDVSGRGASGDVGWIYITGGASHKWRIYKWGGPGYDYRNNDPMSEVNHPFDDWFFNSGKFGSTEYGLENIQAILSDTLTGKFYGPNAYNWNLTLGNQFNDTLGYWSTCINLGQVTANGHYYTGNIFAFNVGNNTQKAGAGPNNNKNPLWVNLGGWNPMDTVKGLYAKYGTNQSIDSVTILYTNRLGSFPMYRPTLASAGLLQAGTFNPVTKTGADLGGIFPRTPPDLGYLQYPFTQLCNCIVTPNPSQ